MLQNRIAQWAANTPLNPIEVDCVTAVMLKILDGKCKMDRQEKIVMAWLYEAVRGQSGRVLGPALHTLIAKARDQMDETLRESIYEQRVLAETMISRPAMKAFKAMLRERGLFELAAEAEA